MTIFAVTDCSNDSQLQDFINQASDGDTIIFACSGTVTLTSQLLIKGKGQTKSGLTLDGNGEAVVVDGGKHMGVLLVEDMRLTLKGLMIANGNAVQGGGLFNTGGEVTITNCTFCGNSAQHGGGLLNEGRVSITNCTFCGNEARAWGGGLYNNFGGDATLSHCTFAHNIATIGGGWATGFPPIRVSATIVANNIAKFRWNNSEGAISHLGFNLEGGAGGFSSMPTDQQTTDSILDPAGLQNHGGPTQTLSLQAGGPAIGAVTDTTLCPDTDQRGWLRPEGLTCCDIGAYQSSYLAPPAPPSRL